MIRLYENKKALIESSGETYKYHFFDCVFEVLKNVKYADVFAEDGKKSLLDNFSLFNRNKTLM